MISATSTDATPPQAAHRPRVLYVCTHNAGRSALAAALTRARAGEPDLMAPAARASGLWV